MQSGEYDVLYRKYRSITDYCRKPISNSSFIAISKVDLMRYAVSLGSSIGVRLEEQSVQFYEGLIDLAYDIDASRRVYRVRSDYLTAEISIRNVVSFLLGMVAAKAVSEKQYHVWALLHMRDKVLNTDLISGKRCPDFFGVSTDGSKAAFLVEAKGSANEGPDRSTVNNAIGQLENVRSVSFVNSATSYTLFENHVIATGCSQDGQNQPIYHDIDPGNSGDVELEFDADKAVASYYQPVLQLLRRHSSTDSSNSEYAEAIVGRYRIGLRRQIIETIGFEQDDSCRSGLFDSVNEICKKGAMKKVHGEASADVSIGLDGIMVERIRS